MIFSCLCPSSSLSSKLFSLQCAGATPILCELPAVCWRRSYLLTHEGLGGHSNSFGAQARVEKKRIGKEWAGGEAIERYTVIGRPFCMRYKSLAIANQCRTLFFQFSDSSVAPARSQRSQITLEAPYFSGRADFCDCVKL